jgi:hypothetical protein
LILNMNGWKLTTFDSSHDTNAASQGQKPPLQNRASKQCLILIAECARQES